MMPQVLPKKRSEKSDERRISTSSSTNSSNNHNHTPNRPTPTSNRIMANRKVLNRIMSARHVSRSIAEDADTSNSFDDGIGFNENKHTIMSNFEEWIKMATDNKITVKNSWNFDLIDYFHDLNVIKDGESINFQRASATLDGCVKIYSNRVESAATETGKLLSGLSKKDDGHHGNQEAGNGDDDENGENGDDDRDGNDEDSRKKRKFNRIVESTLVEFDAIKVKKLEQELAIDPLFKKALAEFDEGGAKSLLLNTLNIDVSGRVVFDATSNPIQETEDANQIETDSQQVQELQTSDTKQSAISSLKLFLFKDNENFDDLTLCPSLVEFQSALADVNKAKSILNDFNSKITNAAQEPLAFKESEENNDFDLGDFNDFGGNDDFNDDINTHDNSSHNDPYNNIDNTIMKALFNDKTDSSIYSRTQSTAIMDQDLMAYFDDRMKSNWRGPDNWKVAAFKKANNIDQKQSDSSVKQESSAQTSTARRKPENIIIDFFNDDDDVDEDILFEPPKSLNSILKKGNFKLSDYILPDDIKYNSARLTNLFTKPQIAIMHYGNKRLQGIDGQLLTDQNYFAEQYRQHEEEERDRLANSFHQAECEDFDNDFGDNNDFGGVDFNDALEADVPEVATSETQSVMGKRRPEYVNFSRVAKRVDVKLLKDNLWVVMKNQLADQKEDSPDKEEEEEVAEKQTTIDFKSVVQNVLRTYRPEQAKDLSTSFCFICVLHLANEHGLAIQSNEAHNNLTIIGS